MKITVAELVEILGEGAELEVRVFNSVLPITAIILTQEQVKKIKKAKKDG